MISVPSLAVAVFSYGPSVPCQDLILTLSAVWVAAWWRFEWPAALKGSGFFVYKKVKKKKESFWFTDELTDWFIEKDRQQKQRLPECVLALKKKSGVSKSTTDLGQLVFPPEVSSHGCSLRVLLSIHGFPQPPANPTDRRNVNTAVLQQAAGNQSHAMDFTAVFAFSLH